MATSLKFVTLDVFTSTRYVGNPVAIVHLPKDVTLSQNQKQLIAREFNLSESVILHEQTEADRTKGDVRIDIFTSIAEVPFAGHPTIGTSNYLLRYLSNDPNWSDVKALQTKAGRIPISLSTITSTSTAGKDVSQEGVTISLAHNVHIHTNSALQTKHGITHPVTSIVKGMTFILSELSSLEELARCTRSILPTEQTYTTQSSLDEGWQQGLIATYYYVDLGHHQRQGEEEAKEVEEESSMMVRKIRSRMFGSREDPATGSGASAMCCYLTLNEQRQGEGEGNGKHGPAAEKKYRYHVTQGVEMGRQSDLYITVSLTDDGKQIREVLLSGTAIKVMEGNLEIP